MSIVFSHQGGKAMTIASKGETVTVLGISTRPRSTWIWATNAAAAEAARKRLDLSGHVWWEAAGNGVEPTLVTDIDIGVVALEACESLAAAGFTFAWHGSQSQINRDGWPTTLPGMAAD